MPLRFLPFLILLALVFLPACAPKGDTEIGEVKLEPKQAASIKGAVPPRGKGQPWRLRFSGIGISGVTDPVAVSLTNFGSRPLQINVRGGKPATVEPNQSAEIYRGPMRGLYRAGRGRVPEFEFTILPDGPAKIGLTFDTTALTAPLEVGVFAIRPPAPGR